MLILADNAFGTLGANLGAGATALSLTAGHGARFPAIAAGDVLPLCIIDASGMEEIIATARAVDALTVVRAMGGTTTRAFSTGAKVQCRLSSEALARLVAEAARGIDVTGTNTYVGAWSPAPIGYVKGVTYRIIVANANTGASTLNLNGLGAKSIKKNVNQDLTPGDMPAGAVAEMVYDGTNMQLLNPATSVWQPGNVKYNATPDDEAGWLAFQTAPVARATYAALFAKLIKQKNGTTVNGNAQITAMGDTSNLKVGMRVHGTGIRPGSRIQSIDSGVAITMTKTASASNVGTALEFSWWGNGDGATTFNVPPPNRVPMAAGSATTIVETFASADIDTAQNTIKVLKNKDTWTHGRQVTIGGSGSFPTTSPAGLMDNGDTAFVYRVDDETIKLCTTRALTQAQAPTFIDITNAGAGNFTLTATMTDRVVGESGGEEAHTLIVDELPPMVFGVSTRQHTDAAGNVTPDTLVTSVGGNTVAVIPPYEVFYGMVKT